MDLSQILENAILGTDPGVRAAAESQLNDAAEHHYPEYIAMLAKTLGDESARTEARMLAGIALKNQLVAKDRAVRTKHQDRWHGLSADIKDHVKATGLQALVSPDERVGRSAAQLIAAIAELELPHDQWPQLLPVMIDHTRHESPDHVKRAALLAIGYSCEGLNPNDPAVAAHANGILVAVIQGAQPHEPPAVRLTALAALATALEFIAANFATDGERNYIMQVVCEATQAPQADLQEAAFGCLARIMALYYRYMAVYMEKALFTLTVLGIHSPHDRVACMAIEFWCAVCDEEIDAAVQGHELGPAAPGPAPTYNFGLAALPTVVPALLEALTRQNADPDDDDWSVSMAAGACLQLFAHNTGNYVIDPALSFASQHIASTNWRYRDAAVMAVGLIVDGPDLVNLAPPLDQAVPPIAALITDDSRHVRDTVAWCLGKIADTAIPALDLPRHLPAILDAVAVGLKDHPKVVTNCCWTFMNLVELLCTQGPAAPASPLSPYIGPIVATLVELSKLPDNDGSCRDAAFEALSVYVHTSANDAVPVIYNMADDAITRLEHTIHQLSSASASASVTPDANPTANTNLQDLQTSILALLTTIIRRLGPETATASDKLMVVFLKVLGGLAPNALIEEDVFIAISAVATAIGPPFNTYMEAFLPFLSKGLTNTASPTAVVAVGIVADLAHSLGPLILPYLQDLMNVLGQNLSNNDVDLGLKPAILACFGHLATALGPQFEPYVGFVMQMCQIATTIPDDGTAETADFLFSIRESVLECYAGIVGGLQDCSQSLLPFMGDIFLLLQPISADIDLMSIESIASAVVGLLGDIATMYPGDQFQQVYDTLWVTDAIKRTRANPTFSDSTRNTARWARDQQRKKIT